MTVLYPFVPPSAITAGMLELLARAVAAAFPGYPPYGGTYADVVPHLTVGDRPAGGVADLRAAEAEVPLAAG